MGYSNSINEDVDSDNYVDKGVNGEEEEISDVDIKLCKFTTYGGDFIVRQLMDMLTEGEIETPKIQRHYVWTNKIASRFIESILLDIPIPSIFLAKSKEEKFVIVDGLQRLTTLYKYIVEGTIDGVIFKLSESKDIRAEWRGKAFKELDTEDQRRLRNKLLHAIIVEQKEPENFDGLFLIFERINTGGLQLNQQEIRNAIFQEPINIAINELNDDERWRRMFGTKSPHSRMRDNEMILRFLALDNINLFNYNKESLNMVSLLNRFMESNKKCNETAIKSYKEKFLKVINTVADLFGEEIFRTNIQNLQVTQRFYATLYDALMLATSFAIYKGIDFCSISNKEQKIKQLFFNDEFRKACSAHTTDLSAIKTRVNKSCEILYGLTYES